MLEPTTDLVACLVPALDLGCKAGRGEEVKPADEQELAPAWPTPPPSQMTLPIYYHWEFRTGTGGEAVCRTRVPEGNVPGDGSLKTEY